MSTHSEKYALLFSMTSEIRHSGASAQTGEILNQIARAREPRVADSSWACGGLFTMCRAHAAQPGRTGTCPTKASPADVVLRRISVVRARLDERSESTHLAGLAVY